MGFFLDGLFTALLVGSFFDGSGAPPFKDLNQYYDQDYKELRTNTLKKVAEKYHPPFGQCFNKDNEPSNMIMEITEDKNSPGTFKIVLTKGFPQDGPQRVAYRGCTCNGGSVFASDNNMKIGLQVMKEDGILYFVAKVTRPDGTVSDMCALRLMKKKKE